MSLIDDLIAEKIASLKHVMEPRVVDDVVAAIRHRERQQMAVAIRARFVDGVWDLDYEILDQIEAGDRR